jgi:PEGA domain
LNERPIGRKRTTLAAIIAGATALSFAPAAMAAKPTPVTTTPAMTPVPAAPRPDLAAAKKHYADAEKKFKAGDFSGALTGFQAANEIKSTPQAERYIGLAEDALGQPQSAIALYEKFLEHVPDKMGPQGEETRKRVAEIKALPGKVHVESNPPGATVAIDGKPLPTPTPVDAELSPGTHAIKLTAAGRLPTEKEVDVAFASSQTVTADLDVEPPPPAPPPPPPVAVAQPLPAAPPIVEPHSKLPAFVTGGLAIAAAGVGTVFGVLALNDKTDFDKNPTTSTADNGDTHALIADMAFGVALTFGVTSAVLFLTKDEQPTAPATATAAPIDDTCARPDCRGVAREGRPVTKSHVTLTPTPWVGARSGGAGFVLRF